MSRVQTIHTGAPRSNTRRVNKAELQQRRKVILGRVKLMAGTTLTAAFMISSLMMMNRAFEVTAWDIQIEGSAPASLEQQVDRAMHSLKAYDFWSTRPSVLRQHILNAVPDLEEVEIQRSLGGTLQLRAIPRTAIGLWQGEKNRVVLVDMHGTAYRTLQGGEIADLPILRLAQHDIRQASQLLQILKSSQPERFMEISELSTDSRNWKINFTQGQQWMISRNTNISGAIYRIDSLLKKPRWRSGHWRIDARAASRWFIRPARQEGVI